MTRQWPRCTNMWRPLWSVLLWTKSGMCVRTYAASSWNSNPVLPTCLAPRKSIISISLELTIASNCHSIWIIWNASTRKLSLLFWMWYAPMLYGILKRNSNKLVKLSSWHWELLILTIKTTNLKSPNLLKLCAKKLTIRRWSVSLTNV